MTNEEFLAIPVCDDPKRAVWLEDSDQRGIVFPVTGEEWHFGRFEGNVLKRWLVQPAKVVDKVTHPA